jgi:branched-chain amino acid transport system substrate-binding protein
MTSPSRTLASNELHFKMTFTTFLGQLMDLLVKNVGTQILAHTYTYPTPPPVKYPDVTYGPNTADLVAAYSAANNREPNFLNAAGYNAGLIIQDMPGTAKEFTQLGFHAVLMDLSGNKMTTLLGKFEINANGAQFGELLPVAQLIPENDVNKVVVYPDDKATGKPVYPAPQQ